MAANTSGYSNREIFELKEDAVKRVREMQSRVRQTVDTSNAAISNSPPINIPPSHHSQSHSTPIAAPVHHHSDDTKTHEQHEQHAASLLKLPFELDNDRIILLALIYLLINEGADKMLILALLYLLI